MTFIDGTAVNVALPALQANLNATVGDVQWVVESYALFLAALLLVGGSLGDHHGRKLIFSVGVAFFALASVWCGVAPNISQLIAARAIQGVGAALLVPGSLAIISASFSKEDRGQAIGTWSGFTAITGAAGPVLSGWLIENVSWRAVFFINVPLAGIVLALVFWRVPESRDEKAGSRSDWLGATLATLSLAAIVYGLIESSFLGFGSLRVHTALILGALASAFFIFVEAKTKDAMMPLSLFRSQDFRGANLLTLFLYAALAGSLFFLPLNLIQVQGYSATAAGAALLPLILIMFLLSRCDDAAPRYTGSIREEPQPPELNLREEGDCAVWQAQSRFSSTLSVQCLSNEFTIRYRSLVEPHEFGIVSMEASPPLLASNIFRYDSLRLFSGPTVPHQPESSLDRPTHVYGPNSL